mmetsp:Transcript_3994/g.8994  ORF Transcript_3994/g.8994 Transcript_3994/m.8994 type:complete len:532 (-) Transcript_3994:311-1906(-)
MLRSLAVMALLTPALGQTAAQPPLMPLPDSYSVAMEGEVVLDGLFKFSAEGAAEQDPLLQRAMERYSALIAAPAASTGSLKGCTVVVDVAANTSSIVGADESYQLSVSASDCQITAPTTWGALRGLETFSQLLVRASGQPADTAAVSVVSSSVEVKDAPRFAHRGLLVDTSRHYLGLPTLRNLLDAMPAQKLNVLHWHAVDAQSFPLDTPSEPTLVKGAYSPSMVYSMADVAELQSYARDRGVMLLLEVDVPGHAASWTKGKPEVMADCLAKYTNINNYALNPAKEETYTTLAHVLADLVAATDLAPEGQMHAQKQRGREGEDSGMPLHLGGDEVVYGCWSNDPSITSFMAQHGMTSYDQLLAYFVSRADRMASALGRRVIHWEEVFSAGCAIDANNFFQVWTDSSMVSAITQAGYQVIASPSDYWYLNIATNTWQHVYSYEPYAGLTSAQQQLIRGGEIALWGEYVDDVNLLTSLFPRLCVGAERLWSAQYVTDETAALQRLMAQRCRLLNRGTASSPIQPGDYCDVTYV